MTPSTLRASLFSIALALASCGTQPVGTGLPANALTTCNTCHGGPVNAAPPIALDGATATTDPGVGAHQSHLLDGPLRKAVSCNECHVVPKLITDPGHIDGVVEVVFGVLATTKGSAPIWDRPSNSCSASYCHGATLSGGTNKTPIWTQVDGTQAACGTCHGDPPPTPHPQNPSCNQCHPLTVLPSGMIDVAGGHHIDGVLDVAALTCSSCHGSAANPAPPVATTGATATTDIRVGAHQAHLTDGPLRSAMACSECHIVPTAVDSPGHIVAGPAPVIFGALATSGGSAPAWNPNPITPTCSNVYCHGDQLAGGTNRTPNWIVVDGTQTACGTCHGNPPPAPHPQNPSCSVCHGLTVLPSGAIDVAGGHHVNGVLEVSTP